MEIIWLKLEFVYRADASKSFKSPAMGYLMSRSNRTPTSHLTAYILIMNTNI